VYVSVVSVKVPEGVKEKMKRTRDKVDWPQEIRSFIENKIEELERKERADSVKQMLAKLPTQAKGTASELVRHDRDSH
jgi:hypothetical protein